MSFEINWENANQPTVRTNTLFAEPIQTIVKDHSLFQTRLYRVSHTNGEFQSK